MADYEKFLQDREFADAFTSAYGGRHDPADALWWMSHPEATSPRGVPSPAADLARLKSLAYSRAGGAEARHALAQLEASLAADREAALAALGRLTPELPHRIAPEALPSTPLLQSAATRITAAEPRPAGARFVAIAALIALAAGIAAGIGFGRTLAPAAMVAAPSSTGESLSRWAKGAPKMLDVFDTRQVAADIPTTIPAGNPLRADSIRLIVSGRKTPDRPTQSVYVAKNTAGSPCLILIIGDGEQTTMNCVPEADIPITGLSVNLQTATDFWTTTWHTDGTILSSGGSMASLADDASAADD